MEGGWFVNLHDRELALLLFSGISVSTWVWPPAEALLPCLVLANPLLRTGLLSLVLSCWLKSCSKWISKSELGSCHSRFSCYLLGILVYWISYMLIFLVTGLCWTWDAACLWTIQFGFFTVTSWVATISSTHSSVSNIASYILRSQWWTPIVAQWWARPIWL